MSYKNKIYELLELSPPPSRIARNLRLFIILLIFLNVLAIILETVGGLFASYERLFHSFEIFSVIIFTIEYVLRLWSCGVDNKYRGFKGLLKFVTKPLVIIDLLAILPFYLPFFVAFDLRVIRAFRLIRIFRILKLGRYSESMTTIARVLKNKREELLVTLFTLGVLLVIASSLMFYFEHDAQPDKFSSIPATMWWAMITLTTVGYGDMYPITVAGKLFGGLIAILGVGMFALPAAILASAFSEEIRKNNKKSNYCPHCGENLNHN